MKNLSKVFILSALFSAGLATFPLKITLANAQNKAPSAPVWRIIPNQSSISWTSVWAGNNVTGSFPNIVANIRFDANNLAGSSVNVSVPVASFATNSREARENLPLPDWLNIRAHPNAVFSANNFVKTGMNTYYANGFLTIKGVRYALNLPFTLNIVQNRAEMTSQVSLDRINLRIGLDSDSKAEWVGRNVRLNIIVKATK